MSIDHIGILVLVTLIIVVSIIFFITHPGAWHRFLHSNNDDGENDPQEPGGRGTQAYKNDLC